MKLVDITKENWMNVIFLTTNQRVTQESSYIFKGKDHGII